MARPMRCRTRNLNLCPLVQHKPPTPRPGCHRTTTSRKPTRSNAKESGLNAPTRDPGLGRPIKRRHDVGTAPVAGRCTLYGALHPIRTGAMPTDRVQCPRIWCTALADKNDRGTWNPTTRKKAASTALHITRDVAGQSSGDVTRGATPVAWRCTRYVALHPLRGAAPVMWRCTRSERVQCLRIGCNAHGSGAMPTDRVYWARR